MTSVVCHKPTAARPGDELWCLVVEGMVDDLLDPHFTFLQLAFAGVRNNFGLDIAGEERRVAVIIPAVEVVNEIPRKVPSHHLEDFASSMLKDVT